MGNKEKKEVKMPSAYSILILIIIVLAVITHFIPSVESASLSQVVMAAPSGFVDAIDVCVFVLVIGGFLGVMNKTGALHAGIASIVRKQKGKEFLLIPILMTVLSLGGTTYGMCEETIAFYALIVATMMAAGFDAMVGTAIILLGAGVGCLGSTVNPFAIAAAVDALQGAHPDIVINQTIVISLGAILWITSLIVSILYVMRYAKKVKNSGKSILTVAEKANSEAAYGGGSNEEYAVLSKRQKASLIIFAISFVIMIVSLIPWGSFGFSMPGWTGLLTGMVLGDWYFQELQAWFLLMAILIGVISKTKEKEWVAAFVSGAGDMIGVVLVIAVSRGISVIMSQTGLDVYVLEHASNALRNVSPTLYTCGSYVIYLGLSFLIPSTSGLAAASMPTFGALTANIGLCPEVMILIFCAACGVVNLITPTSAVVMGGTQIAKIEWPTWVKFVAKLIGILIVMNIVILSIAMLIC